MERLTRVYEEDNQKYVCIDVCGEKCIENNEWCPECKPFTDVMKKLAHYEDLEEQGLLKTVVRGEWKSECGLFFPIYRCSECNCASALGQTKFCPNCGADMRKLKEMDGK